MKVLVTGAKGFIGSNLLERLGHLPDLNVLTFDRENAEQELRQQLDYVDFVYHLAGVNRPESDDEFRTVNVDLTDRMCDHLLTMRRAVPIVFSSSAQVLLDNPYGISKREAERVLGRYAARSGAMVAVYRLTNVFGKWCRPNYNSVVATFCHKIARGLPISISNPPRKLSLIYIDDVVHSFVLELRASRKAGLSCRAVLPVHSVTLGDLGKLLFSFRDMRRKLVLPDLSDQFVRKLYATYLSHLDGGDFAYLLDRKCDDRGCLAEFVKSASSGQIFVSRTVPGAVRGGHYHNTKVEKFLVLGGVALVTFRNMRTGDAVEYEVHGKDMRVLDIPPGVEHSLRNTGISDLITVFWASEIFDRGNPDTYGVGVPDVQG